MKSRTPLVVLLLHGPGGARAQFVAYWRSELERMAPKTVLLN